MENNNRFKKYALEVVSYIMCSERKARLIKEDIVNHLQEKSSQTGETDPVRLMGEPFDAVSACGIAAFGGMAVANYCSIGGFAVSNNIAIGGYASGRIIAIGGVARGEICIFNQSGVGEHLFNMNELTTDNIITSIKQIKPDLDGLVQNVIRLFGN